MSFGDYQANILWGLVYLIKAIFTGKPFPRMPKNIQRLDGSSYYNPSYDEFLEALREIHILMRKTGWNVDEYKKNAKDCEDFATKMAVEIRNYIANNFQTGNNGVSVGVVAFIEDSSQNGHAIVKVILKGGKELYFEPYPNDRFLAPLDLSKRERLSIFTEIF
jgi:hypothetical protein